MINRHRPGADGLLGPLEYAVMVALWQRAPASVPEVRERVNRHRDAQAALAYTTVMTVLSRLYDKGLVTRDRRGRGYTYTPRYDEAGLVDHLGCQEVGALLARYGDVALAHFAAALEDADEGLRARIRALGEHHDA